MADESKKIKLQDDELVPVLRNEFINGTAFPADVFFRLTENYYILVAHAGDKANIKELKLSDEVNFLYVKKSEFKSFVGQSISIAGVLMNRVGLSIDKKAIFISKASSSVSKELSQLGITHEALEHAKFVANNIKTLIELKSDIFAIMELFGSLSLGQLDYAMAVSMVSVALAKNMGWNMNATLEKISLGCLLQDVGMKEFPKSLILKPRHELTNDERSLFETHPFRSAEILRSMPSISDEVISIAYEHHENAIATGYPRRIKDLKMNPLAKVVALSNAFCELTIKSGNNANPRTAAKAIEYLDVTMGQPFNEQAFKALRVIFNVPEVQAA